MNELEKINAKRQAAKRTFWVWLTVILSLATFNNTSYSEQPPAPCFPNPRAARDSALIKNRGDIRNLPEPLKARIIRISDRPHSILPTQAFAEADKPSQLFEYYLLDTNEFQPNSSPALFLASMTQLYRRQPTRPTVVYPASDQFASCSNQSRDCQLIRIIQRRSSTCSPTSRVCLLLITKAAGMKAG